MIIANEEAIKSHNLKPLARVVDYCVVGVDPTIMGIGPASAIKQLLSKQRLSLADVDLIEVVIVLHKYTCTCTHKHTAHAY